MSSRALPNRARFGSFAHHSRLGQAMEKREPLDWIVVQRIVGGKFSVAQAGVETEPLADRGEGNHGDRRPERSFATRKEAEEFARARNAESGERDPSSDNSDAGKVRWLESPLPQADPMSAED